MSIVEDIFEPYKTDVFLDELLVTRGNVAASARKAGIDPLYARKLMAMPEWQRDFKRRYEAIYGPLDLRVQESMREWEALAHSDIRDAYGPDWKLLQPQDWPEHFARAVASVKVQTRILDDGSETGEVISERTTILKLWDKVQAHTQLSKIQGLISNDINITSKLQVESSPIPLDSLPLWNKLLLIHVLEGKPISTQLQSAILAEVQPNLINISVSEQTSFYVLNPWETSSESDND